MVEVRRFSRIVVTTPDPLRPGQVYREHRWRATNDHTLTVAGQTFFAKDNGWFDVPLGVAQVLCADAHWMDRAKLLQSTIEGPTDLP